MQRYYMHCFITGTQEEMCEYLASNWCILFGSEGLVVPADIRLGFEVSTDQAVWVNAEVLKISGR